ncbi:MAG: ABC-F family ATP-binding cassette domain-containing protein [Lentisphaerae bacterium]|nr:ABC-F family ATP-binding cassette domain-containing protein [Lentisphaerota bacterium]
MIELRNVTVRYGAQEVLNAVGLQINRGERVGIVGPNGAGKSTLFSLVTGDMLPHGGQVLIPDSFRIALVRQQHAPSEMHEPLLDFACAGAEDLAEMERDLAALAAKLAAAGDSEKPRLLRELGEVQTAFEHRAGYSLCARAEKALCGLGFAPDSLRGPLNSFSGGWRMRAELARAMLADPDILLLDEPSNYLDLPAVEWLQDSLRSFRGTLLLISHDRYLLRSLTTLTVEVANGAVTRYAGGYDYYAQERERRYRQQLAASENQQRKREQLERFIERFKAKNTLATQAQSRVKQLARMEKIEVIRPVATRGRIRLPEPPHCGVEVVRLESAGVSYDGKRWVLRGLDFSVSRGDRVALVGYNGLGKTTLLRMIAGALEPTEGRRVLGHKVVVGYQSQDFAETMDPSATVFEVVRAAAGNSSDQDVRSLLGGFGFSGYAVEKRVQVLSGGEKVRLAFARLLVRPASLLVLDEPTTHLDIQSCEALQDALREYKGTICLVSHDIDFVRAIATNIVAMTPPGVTRYAGGYDYYKQKSEQAAGQQNAAPSEPAPETGKKPVTDKKELRRQRALERQALHERTKGLKKEVARAEKQIETYEAERARLVEQMEGAPAGMDFADLNRRLKFIEQEIADYTRRWEDAAEAMEAIEKETSG